MIREYPTDDMGLTKFEETEAFAKWLHDAYEQETDLRKKEQLQIAKSVYRDYTIHAYDTTVKEIFGKGAGYGK